MPIARKIYAHDNIFAESSNLKENDGATYSVTHFKSITRLKILPSRYLQANR
jgi:hypothetical protein